MLVFMVIVASLGGLLFGFDTGIIADAQDLVINQFNLSSFQWSMIVSVTALSAAVGSVSCGKIADAFGRKNTLIVISILFIFGTALLSFAWSYETLLVGRAIVGFCIGISSFICPLFISEVSPKKIRGTLIVTNIITITGGEALSFLIGYALYPVGPYSWRLMFAVGIIPAVLLFLGLLFMPKSPRWVAKKNDFKTSYEILKSIRNNLREAREEILEIRDALLCEQGTKANFWTMFKKPFYTVLIIGLVLGIGQQFAGINIIMYYGPFVFQQSGFGTKVALFSAFIMGVTNLFGTIIAMIIIDKLGRRPLFITGTFFAGLSLVAFSLQSMYNLSPTIALVSVFAYILSFAISMGCIFWVVTSEVFPLSIRGQAVSFTVAIQWLANFVVSLVFLPLVDALGIGSTMLLFALVCFGLTVFSYFLLPETKGISLEQIEENLYNGKKFRDLGA